MWSDNDIDNAFQRLNPPEPEPAPFPLDAWLRLETQLDQEAVARTVRRKVWRFFALEVLVVALLGLGWLLWKPAGPVVPAASRVAAAGAADSSSQSLSAPVAAQPKAVSQPRATASAPAASALELTTATVAKASASAEKAEPAASPAPAAASGHHRLAPEHSSPALAVVAAKPSLYARPERRTAEDRASRRPWAAALGASDSRKASRSTEAQAQRGYQSTVSAVYGQPKAQAASVAAASDAPTAALPAEGRPRRGARLKQQPESFAASQATEASANNAPLAVAPSDENELMDADNLELPTRPVTVAAAAALPLPTPLALAAVAETKPATLAPEPRFFIGLVGAPDVSTVKFVSVEKPLLNLGLVLEYRFTNRLRISTGLLRANKEYYARREDYDWTNYPRAQARDITWVEGKCTVLDVPLNLRYDAVVRDNARWFGTAGLSSFFMHRENYSYDYLEGGDYKLWEMPGLVNANQHLFSVLNLSAGYERSLGPHWRLQAEPYVKVPLGGVGAGKVKLTSAGVFLGVKYGF